MARTSPETLLNFQGLLEHFIQGHTEASPGNYDRTAAASATTSKFWGVSWDKSNRRWKAVYKDANGKTHTIGRFDTQEEAAHAVNAAIRRAGLEGKRRTNPVVDGQLVPRAWKKRRREKSGAANAPARVRTEE